METTKKKIIICDENVLLMEALSMVLPTDKYEIFQAFGLKSLADLIKKNDVQLLLLSSEILWQCNNYPALQNYVCTSNTNLPVIVMSSGAYDSYLTEMFHADGLLEKPFDLNDLYRQVDRCINSSTKNKAQNSTMYTLKSASFTDCQFPYLNFNPAQPLYPSMKYAE